MLRAVIFDIDGTLYDYNAAHRHAYAALTEYACDAFGLTPERFDALHAEADRLLRRRAGCCAAIHNRLLRYQLMLEQLGQPISHAPALSELYWSTLLLWMKPFPGLQETFARLRAMGLRIGIGTNMTADRQYDKLDRLGVMPLVDFMVTSEEVSAEKPDRRLFDLCAEKAGCAPAECAFVGDSLRGDVLGAKAAGMWPVWFCTGSDVVEDVPGAARIAALAELPELLSKEF